MGERASEAPGAVAERIVATATGTSDWPGGCSNAGSTTVGAAGGYTLGAQAGEAAIRQLITDAGFTRFRRAAETPFNFVYEARP
jgi:hypothetical protein